MARINLGSASEEPDEEGNMVRRRRYPTTMFDGDTIDAMGLSASQVGDEVELSFRGRVSSRSDMDVDGNTSRTVGVDLVEGEGPTAVAYTAGGQSRGDRAERLYDRSSAGGRGNKPGNRPKR